MRQTAHNTATASNAIHLNIYNECEKVLSFGYFRLPLQPKQGSGCWFVTCCAHILIVHL